MPLFSSRALCPERNEMHLTRKLLFVGIFGILTACLPSLGSKLDSVPALHPKNVGATVPRPISIGTSSPRDAEYFYKRALPLGAYEHALLYPTVGKIETGDFTAYPRQTNIILALKFFPMKGCGAGPHGEMPVDKIKCPGVLKEILGGRFDADLSAIGKMIVDDGRGVTIRHMYEANGNGYPWQAYYPGNNPKDYTAAWLHVANILKVAAGDLAAFDFSVNRYGPKGAIEKDFAELYPGNAIVDRVTIDAYNRCGTAERYVTAPSFETQFGAAYEAVAASIDPRIPIGVGETNTSALTDPPKCAIDRIEWFRGMFRDIEERFPRVDQLTIFLEKVKIGGASNDVPIDWGIYGDRVAGFCKINNEFRAELNATYKDPNKNILVKCE